MKKSKLKVDNKLIADPLDDSEIRQILGNPRIMKYSELKNYNKIEDILTNSIFDYIILLIEAQMNSGHWVCIVRKYNKVFYFDSYALYPAFPINWNSQQTNNELGQHKTYLLDLFNNSDLDIEYNKIVYQNEMSSNVNTCGRHCIVFILLCKYGLDLNTYYDFMQCMKKQLKMNYDQIVAYLIDSNEHYKS